jgi:hypothetical protein
MERKLGGSTAAVAAAEVNAALGRVRTLSSEEERALRMRYGGKTDLGGPLPQAAAGNEELQDELLLIEMQLMKAWRSRLGMSVVNGKVVHAQPSKAKDKIVRALRKKR